MIFSIDYRTEYHYEGSVREQKNAIRVKPATTAWQRCDEFELAIDPRTQVQGYTDYFGTRVHEFGLADPHDRLRIDVRSTVVTAQPPAPPSGSWEALASDLYGERAVEFVPPVAPLPPSSSGLAELADETRRDTPLATLEAVTHLIPDRFEYRTGVTYVGSTVEDLLTSGAGVCQDFTHLGIALLRQHGIAARYVSGYFYAESPSSEDGLSSEFETHAWIEALMPFPDPDLGPLWVAADPTNSTLADDRHVKIGHGRGYSDVPPIKGVYQGPPASRLEARVTMRRLEAEPPRPEQQRPVDDPPTGLHGIVPRR